MIQIYFSIKCCPYDVCMATILRRLVIEWDKCEIGESNLGEVRRGDRLDSSLEGQG